MYTRGVPAVQILDGPMGTELIAAGVGLSGPAWSASAVREAPDAIAEVHRAYVEAGATVHTANTFRTQPATLDNWADAAATAVRLARDSVPSGHRVAGSMAPVADCYRPDLSPGEAARADHRALAEVLVETGCDLLLCETFAVRREALVAVEEALRTGAPTWLALTSGPEASLLSPVEIAAIAREAVALGASQVLVNCVAATRMAPFVNALAEAGLPFGVYANAGARQDAVGWGHQEGPDHYAALAEQWAAQGARTIGGCCGTSPAHIRAVRERLFVD